MVSDKAGLVDEDRKPIVLILVLMEYGLWHSDETFICYPFTVLILVLMEYGLWLPDALRKDRKRKS